MISLNKAFILVLFSFLTVSVYSQIPGFSIATDVGIQHNFKHDQEYWAVGNTIQAQFHLDKKNSIYAWFANYTNGRFKNYVTATAKSPATLPQEIDYRNSAKMRLKQISIGWKRFLTGSFNEERKWSIYAYGGFGLVLGRIINTHSTSIDTSQYELPVLPGKANFKRLTFDVGAGIDIPLTTDFYLYFESKLWVPTDGYPSRHILVNDKAPYVGMLGGGLRLLF